MKRTNPQRRTPTRVRRVPIVAGVAAGTLLLLATPAFAHVTVQPGEAEQGSYSTINFKVPNERDNASTVKLEVVFPADHPLASVMPQPVPGWQVKLTKTKLAKPVELEGSKVTKAVSKITWTGGKIRPDTFQQFPVSVGELPKNTERLVFKALQTYSSKEVVRWIEVPNKGAPEPENPAPVLNLVPPGQAGADAGAPAGDSADATTGSRTAASASDSGSGGSDTWARVLGVAGVVLGAAGVVTGLVAARRRTD